MKYGFKLTIAKVRPGSLIEAGATSPPLYDSATLGRGPDTAFPLQERSISYEHAKVSRDAEGFEVKALSQNSATFVDGVKIEHGESLYFKREALWLQVGRVLLHLEALPQTVPTFEPISLPSNADVLHVPLLAVRLEPNLEVWFLGSPLHTYPSVAKMLGKLCQLPGQVVTYDELARAIDPEEHTRQGGMNFSQITTYARDSLERAMEASEHQGEVLESLNVVLEQGASVRDILHRLIENVRGVGYRLNVHPYKVKVLDANDLPPRRAG